MSHLSDDTGSDLSSISDDNNDCDHHDEEISIGESKGPLNTNIVVEPKTPIRNDSIKTAVTTPSTATSSVRKVLKSLWGLPGSKNNNGLNSTGLSIKKSTETQSQTETQLPVTLEPKVLVVTPEKSESDDAKRCWIAPEIETTVATAAEGQCSIIKADKTVASDSNTAATTSSSTPKAVLESVDSEKTINTKVIPSKPKISILPWGQKKLNLKKSESQDKSTEKPSESSTETVKSSESDPVKSSETVEIKPSETLSETIKPTKSPESDSKIIVSIASAISPSATPETQTHSQTQTQNTTNDIDTPVSVTQTKPQSQTEETQVVKKTTPTIPRPDRPLASNWSLWSKVKSTFTETQDFGETQFTEVLKFGSLEKFALVHRSIERASGIGKGIFGKATSVSDKTIDSIAYFREHSYPSPDSTACKGRWDCRLNLNNKSKNLKVNKKSSSFSWSQIDRMWDELVYMVIGENFWMKGEVDRGLNNEVIGTNSDTSKNDSDMNSENDSDMINTEETSEDALDSDQAKFLSLDLTPIPEDSQNDNQSENEEGWETATSKKSLKNSKKKSISTSIDSISPAQKSNKSSSTATTTSTTPISTVSSDSPTSSVTESNVNEANSNSNSPTDNSNTNGKIPHQPLILGVLMSPRARSKVVKLEVWMNTSEEKYCRAIGQQMMRCLNKALEIEEYWSESEKKKSNSKSKRKDKKETSFVVQTIEKIKYISMSKKGESESEDSENEEEDDEEEDEDSLQREVLYTVRRNDIIDIRRQ